MIKITDITPFMRKGWVAMDFGGEWFWYNEKPTIHNDSIWHSPDDITFCISLMYDISPADDWMVWGEIIGNIHENADLFEVGGK